MYHKLVVVGHLGRDPEMRYTASGTPVTNFSVATSRRWTDQQGEQREETVWIRVACWGKLAETTNQYLNKGRLVLVEGRLQPDPESGGPRVWTGNDGATRASFEMTAETVRFLGGQQTAEPQEASEELDEEEVPF